MLIELLLYVFLIEGSTSVISIIYTNIQHKALQIEIRQDINQSLSEEEKIRIFDNTYSLEVVRVPTFILNTPNGSFPLSLVQVLLNKIDANTLYRLDEEDPQAFIRWLVEKGVVTFRNNTVIKSNAERQWDVFYYKFTSSIEKLHGDLVESMEDREELA